MNMQKKSKHIVHNFKYIIIFILLLNFQFGQYGKNIVQYKNFNWKFIQTIHFDIYFSTNNETNINFVANLAEEAYSKISNLIGWNLDERSSKVVYSSHIEFQQTNIISSYMNTNTSNS